MEKYINKKLYCKQVLGVLCDEAIQVPINSICVVSTNFNDAIPLRRFDTRWNSSKLNEYQRSFCLSSRVAASLFRAEKSTFDDKHDRDIVWAYLTYSDVEKRDKSSRVFSIPPPKNEILTPKTKTLLQNRDLQIQNCSNCGKHVIFHFALAPAVNSWIFLRNDPKTKRIWNGDFEPILGEMVCNLHFSHVEPSKTAPRNSMR